MRKSNLAQLAIITVGLLSLNLAVASDRVALIIGNGKYEHGAPLINPANDAAAMKKGLEALGFEVDVLIDGNSEKMEAAVQGFRGKAAKAKVAWFFFAGHGIEVGGSNYLVLYLDQEADLNSR